MNTLELAQKLTEARQIVDEAIVRNCPVPVLYADKEGKWCYVNEPMEKLLGTETAELLGTRWLKLVKAGRKDWEAVVKGKENFSKFYLKFKAGDGRDVPSYVSLSRLSTGGFIGFILPICEHPSGCPLHGFLLHNIESEKAGAAQERG